MRDGSREHVSHVAMLTHRTPLHHGRPSRVQRYSTSMHRAMEEDSLMTRCDDLINRLCKFTYFALNTYPNDSSMYQNIVVM